MNIERQIESVLVGVAIGDALGVPVEFRSREMLKTNPVKKMIGFGSHHQVPGTWSDDSSLTFCLAESLCFGFSTEHIGQTFLKWFQEAHWTAHNDVFDIGRTTIESLERIRNGVPAEEAGGYDENDNGNGSLMRILPLIFYTKSMSVDERFEITKQVSSITHGHIRSIIACFYYLEFAKLLLEGKDKLDVYKELQTWIPEYLSSLGIDSSEITLFKRLFEEDITTVEEEAIYSSGYVLHTLEASIWSLLTSNSFEEATLKAVNLGEDTDTTGAVTGGLAGIVYGLDDIPDEWLRELIGLDRIRELASEFSYVVD